jgi:hypothetical protein
VAGAAALNAGAEAARGVWIATLRDGEELEPDHVERLLEHARQHRFEMVYGTIVELGSDGSGAREVGEHPPGAAASFALQGALFNSALRFFALDPASWLLDETAEWGVCRRMLAAGVRVGFVDRAVGRRPRR